MDQAATEASNRQSSRPKRKASPILLVDWLLTLGVFYIYGGDLPPGTNESHYLIKAKHFWEPTFLETDFFAASSNAHWFFFLTCGWLTTVFSLPVAAWTGRFVAWSVIAAGWCHLARKFSDVWYAGMISALPFLAALHWGHLSGEWVVGGFEAKCLAYGIAIFAISFYLQGNRLISWGLLGLSSAFHVLTGGWIAICLMLADLFFPVVCRFELTNADTASRNRLSDHSSFAKAVSSWIKDNFVGWLCGGCISLFGLLPALMMNVGADNDTISQGYINQVYGRLNHHLVSTYFEPERWLAHAVALASTAIIAAGLFRLEQRFHSQPTGASANLRDCHADGQLQNLWFNRAAFMFLLSCIALFFACIGGLISYFGPFLSWHWTSGLLRFYWFRFNDVAWPMALAMSLLALWNIVKNNYPTDNGERSTVAASILLTSSLILPGCWLLMARFTEHYTQDVATSDQRAMGAPFYQENSATVSKDWESMCHWIDAKLPHDVLVLTPLNQQNFKWHAQRPEFYCFKDAPQNAEGVNEWQTRRFDSWFLLNRDQGADNLTERVMSLSKKYEITHVVLDRTQFPHGLNLPAIHSTANHEKPSFTLYEIPRH